MTTNFLFLFVSVFALLEVANCRCAHNYFECPNGMCIPDTWDCDRINDRGDAADKLDECPPERFECNNGICIGKAYVCDWVNNCGDWSDENEDACPCADNELRCRTPPGQNTPPGYCIPPEHICDPDGIWDCFDGSDEVNCTSSAAFQFS